jgi:hypothetical protein
MGFDPSVIVPSNGDTIVFEFRSGDHSVVQSSFDNPCTGIEGGFNTGVKTVDDSLSVDAPGLPQVRFPVNDSKPLWFFDEAGGLCNKGAVLAVNPTGEQTAAGFVANALKAPASTPSSTPSGDSTNSDSGSSDPTNSGSQDAPSSTPTGAASRMIVGTSVWGVLVSAFLAMV